MNYESEGEVKLQAKLGVDEWHRNLDVFSQ